MISFSNLFSWTISFPTSYQDKQYYRWSFLMWLLWSSILYPFESNFLIQEYSTSALKCRRTAAKKNINKNNSSAEWHIDFQVPLFHGIRPQNGRLQPKWTFRPVSCLSRWACHRCRCHACHYHWPNFVPVSEADIFLFPALTRAPSKIPQAYNPKWQGHASSPHFNQEVACQLINTSSSLFVFL